MANVVAFHLHSVADAVQRTGLCCLLKRKYIEKPQRSVDYINE